MDEVTSTPSSQLDYIEGQANFFERNLNGRNRSGMTTTTILASVMVLLVRSLIATAKEMRRMNDHNERMERKNDKVLLG